MITFPRHAPFDEAEREALSKLAAGWSVEQRLWLSGFLAGSVGADGVGLPGAGAATGLGAGVGAQRPLVVLYGTESGNCEKLAAQTAALAKKRGFKPRLCNMAETSPDELQKAGNLVVIASTWGEGDPPESAVAFHRSLMNGGPLLSAVRYSVCALGDTSYDQFCEFGKQVDHRLEELGAQRVSPRVDCDVDYEESYLRWVDEALTALGAGGVGGGTAVVPVAGAAGAVEYGKKNPFPAALLAKVLLSGRGSRKETWHYELGLSGSGLAYEPGDSLAVLPRNASDVVEGVLGAAGLSGGEEVETKSDGRKTLQEALTTDFDITALSRKVAKSWQERGGSGELAALLEDGAKDRFRDYVDGRQIVDLMADYPIAGLGAAELVGMLRPLPPRLYSIASSPREHPGEVHLTVASVRYATHGRERKGVASTCLADLLQVGDQVPVYVTPNKRFRLPEGDDVPILMVGPGTGVAPFRAFVEERAARGAKGRSWLFFGDQRYTYDFLYQLEWQEHLKSGALTRIDVAFSRDQPEKVYVQDRLRERAAEVWAWLQDGAHFYVCGDAERMAPDVHAALAGIVAAQGGLSAEGAESYLEELKKRGRYQRDVY